MANGSNESGNTSTPWRASQAFAMATICLVVGLAVGYLLRGSAPVTAPVQAAAAVANVPQGGGAAAMGQPSAAAQPAMGGAMGQQAMPTIEQMKHMADKQAEPLLAKLKTDPNNAALLNQIGTLYRTAHQFQVAEGYYRRSLAINPANVGPRTDLSSCLYYTGDVDGALAELQKSLTYDPKHAGTLFNIGMIKWQAKGDVDGAIASWQTLLRLNPKFEKKDAVLKLIAQAKQHRDKKLPDQKG